MPAVDFDGSSFLVVWADSRDSGSVYGVQMSSSGVVAKVTDTKLAIGTPSRLSPGSMDRVNLAFGGSRHLVSFLGSGIEGSLIEKDLTSSMARSR